MSVDLERSIIPVIGPNIIKKVGIYPKKNPTKSKNAVVVFDNLLLIF